MRREVEIVTLDRGDNGITLKFLSGSRPAAPEVLLNPDLAESLLCMLSRELDPPPIEVTAG
jgi:hypothetical protein